MSLASFALSDWFAGCHGGNNAVIMKILAGKDQRLQG